MTTTVNYSWALPTVGASVNTWGTLVNAVLTDIDAKMVGLTATQTLTNKTLTAPVITGGASITGNLTLGSTNPAILLGTSAMQIYKLSTDMRFYNGSADRMTLDASGNLNMTAGGHIGRTATASGIFFNTNSILPSTGTGATDNTVSAGSASYRWTTIYATTGAINTSDARAKTKVRTLADAEIEAAIEHSKEIGIYQFLESVKVKGDKARLHIGMTVQRSIEIMEKHGLDPMSYAFICHDVWADEFKEHPAIDAVEAKAAVLDDAGNEVEPAIEAVEGKDAWTEQTQTAGDRYAFRYDQLNLFIARGIEARLAALEARA